MTTTRQSQNTIAKTLLDIKAVGFSIDKPITFVSGIHSPVYVDNRQLPFYPKSWRIILDGFQDQIKSKQIKFDVIAGIAKGAISHSAGLGLLLNKPAVYIRKQAKGYGKKDLIVGGNVARKKVLLIEDHITTAGSCLTGIKALQQSGAIVKDCMVITSYGFKEATDVFNKVGVKLHTLTDFKAITQEAIKAHILDKDQLNIVEEWLSDPWKWTEDRKT